MTEMHVGNELAIRQCQPFLFTHIAHINMLAKINAKPCYLCNQQSLVFLAKYFVVTQQISYSESLLQLY